MHHRSYCSTRRRPARHRVAAAALAALLSGACAAGRTTPAAAPAPAPAGSPASGYVPHRVYDTAADRFIDFEAFAARAAAADVVFFGERHGFAPGHRMQHALLEALARRGAATLSMEMFERDAAPLVAAYARGDAQPDALLAGARPWPRYATDYQPLVDFARHLRWPVIAANVPRELANLVAREGVAALDSLAPARRAFAAAELNCPADAYRTRFITEMRRHPMGEPAAPEVEAARDQRYYEAQCVKDETMAEAIAAALRSGMRRPVVHVTGAFHSDYGDGIPVRLLRRVPDAVVTSITIVAVPDLDGADPAPHAGRADYLLFTIDPAAPAPRMAVQPGSPGQPTRRLADAAATTSSGSAPHVAADVRFMHDMIVHHAQAVEMTALVADRTANGTIRLLAQRIAASQEDEMALMRRWLDARGEAMPDAHAQHDAAMPGMIGEAELARLRAAEGTAFDRLFLELMIRHHEGALVMVERLFAAEGAGREPVLFQFASHVDSDQRMEILRMTRMLEALIPGGWNE